MKIEIIKEEKPILKNSLVGPGIRNHDALWAYHPCVLQFKNKYYLFYTGKKVGLGIQHYTLLATSSDLHTWQRFSRNPILKEGNEEEWDSDFTAHAFVFKDKNKFYMLYDGSKKNNWIEEIGLAESTDLTVWKKSNQNPIFKVGKNWWEKRHVSRCCIFKEKGIYYLYYAGHDGERERIGLARGKSLLTLKRFLPTPVLDVGNKGEWDEKSISDPKVIKYKDKYLMFYSGIDTRGREQTGLAVSIDLIQWKKYDKNPVLRVSESGWDKVSATRADIKEINGSLYIFYSGRKKYFYSIGIAKIQIV